MCCVDFSSPGKVIVCTRQILQRGLRMFAKFVLTCSLTFVSLTTALAQNATSRTLLAAPEARRNAAFLLLIHRTKDRCDKVIRTQYNASIGDNDDWEAKCRDGGHYSFSIFSDPSRQSIVISCREMMAGMKMLDQLEKTFGLPFGCRMK